MVPLLSQPCRGKVGSKHHNSSQADWKCVTGKKMGPERPSSPGAAFQTHFPFCSPSRLLLLKFASETGILLQLQELPFGCSVLATPPSLEPKLWFNREKPLLPPVWRSQGGSWVLHRAWQTLPCEEPFLSAR